MWGESRASGIVPSLTPPPHTASQHSDMDCPTLVNTKSSALICNRHAQIKKYGPNESKAAGKIQLSNEEVANLSDAQFKTLVIRMLTEMVEYGCKIEGKVKTMKSEIKENVQGTNTDGKETRTQINGLEQKEETFNQNRIKK